MTLVAYPQDMGEYCLGSYVFGQLVAAGGTGNYTFYIVPSSIPTGALVGVDVNGSFYFVPPTGFIGFTEFFYYVTDGVSTSNQAQVEMTYGNPPVPSPLNYQVAINQLFTGYLEADSQNVFFQIDTASYPGTLTILDNDQVGQFTYLYPGTSPLSPNPTIVTIDYSALYVVSGCESTSSAPLTFTIYDDNASFSQTVTTSPYTGALQNVGSGPFSYVVNTQPSTGTLSLNTTANTFTYTAPSGYVGTVSFVYTATNSNSSPFYITYTVTLNVNVPVPPPPPPAKPPVCTNSSLSFKVNKATPGTLSVTGGKTPYSVHIVTSPKYGKLTMTTSLGFSYLSSQRKNDSFTYYVIDANSLEEQDWHVPRSMSPRFILSLLQEDLVLEEIHQEKGILIESTWFNQRTMEPPTVRCIKAAELRKDGYASLEEWLKDPNHLYIGRDMSFYVPGLTCSKWHNPYPIKKYGLTECLRLYEEHVYSKPT